MLIYRTEWLKALGKQNLSRLTSDGLEMERFADGTSYKIVPNLNESGIAPPSIIANASSTKRDFRTPFATDALNVLNKLAYSTPEEQKWMKARNDHPFSCGAFSIALAGWLRTNYQDKQRLQIKELFATPGTSMWETVANELPSYDLAVTAGGFLASKAQAVIGRNLSIVFERRDAGTPLVPLRTPYRHDVALISYGFDSAWFPSDSLLFFHEGHWFEQPYRIRVPSWHPRRKFVTEALEGRDVPLRAPDVAALSVEMTWQECAKVRNMKNIPVNSTLFSYPGGLIETVEELFERQLSEDGTVIIGELCQGQENTLLPSLLTWGLGTYRALSLGLAVRELKARGYEAKLMTAYEFYDKNTEASQPITLLQGNNLFDRSTDFEAVLIVKRIVH